MRHADDGMSYLTAYIRTSDAVRIDALVSARAKSVESGGRTLDQMRADAFVEQMLSEPGSTVSKRAIVGVVVPVTTLAGVSDEPGEAFDGSFALPAELVRDLADEPGTLFYRILEDPLGRLLDITEIGYAPSEHLRTAIGIRDGTCVFPTCSRPAAECDLDHEIPHPRGPTTATTRQGVNEPRSRNERW